MHITTDIVISKKELKPTIMKNRVWLIAMCMLLPVYSYCQMTPGKVKSYHQEGSAVLFECEKNLVVKLSMLQEDLLRVQMAEDGEFENSMMIEWGFVKMDWTDVAFDLKEQEGSIVISTSALSVRIRKDDFFMEVEDSGGNVFFRESRTVRTTTGKGNVLSMEMPADEHFFGFGFMRKTLDARGLKLTWTRDYRWKEATVPFFMSTRGYGFYSNNTWNHEFDFTTKTEGNVPDYYTITSTAGQMDYFVFYGPAFREILDSYTDLTGKSMLVPKWAFGLEYRYRYLDDQEGLLEIAREFRKREIPCDIMALEPGWEEKPYSMIWEWSSTRFPDGDQMIRELDEMGFKLDLWESGEAPKENLTDPEVRKAWYDKRAGMIDKGVRMFKQDDPYPRSIISTELLGPVLSGEKFSDMVLHAEQLNNVANTLYTETLFKEFKEQTGERAVVMFHAYNASVASHRWPFQWAGDFQAAYGMLNASLSGHAMVSYDIRNPYASGWHQGFFTPFSVVDAWAYYREPWLYSESMEESHRLYACLRSRLVPFFYSSLWQSHTSAVPIERPMVLDWSNDPNTYQLKSQFMAGDWFLVGLSDADDAPAGEKVDFWTGQQKGNTSPVYLPEGRWIDYWTGDEKNMDESKWIMASWPEYMGGHLFVKAGAIIPMGQVKNFIGETEDEIVVLDIYPHEKSSYQLYEDDGITHQYEKGKYAITDLQSLKEKNQLTIDISARKGKYEKMPDRRSFLLKVHSLVVPENISVDGQLMTKFSDVEELIFQEDQAGWFYDQDQKKAIIKIDPGWKYRKKTNGKIPVGIMPLTASHERIEWKSGTIIDERDREIKIRMPEKALPVITADIRGIPADGISRSGMEIRFKDKRFASGIIAAKLEGPASFLNGEKEIQLAVSGGKGSCTIVSGKEAGEARLVVSGNEIEDAAFRLEVYGEPGSMNLEADESLLVADGINSATIRAILYDRKGNHILKASSPIILNVDGEASFENAKQSDTTAYVNGQAVFRIRTTTTPGELSLGGSYGSLKAEELRLHTQKGSMQVRINPPDWIKLESGGDWIPRLVTVFVNFRANDTWVRSCENLVHLKVYDREMNLKAEYEQKAVGGELDFKDVSYYERPASYYFEISSEGYETVTRKVYESTWDQ